MSQQKVCFDATIPIRFKETREFELLKHLPFKIILVEEVWKEITTQKANQYAFEPILRDLKNDDHIAKVKLRSIEAQKISNNLSQRLDDGEADTLAYSVVKELPFGTDDEAAKDKAEEYGKNPLNTLSVLEYLVENDVISLNKSSSLHSMMVLRNFFSPISKDEYEDWFNKRH